MIQNAYALSRKSKTMAGEIKRFYHGTQFCLIPVKGKDTQSFYVYLPQVCTVTNINLHELDEVSLTKAKQRQLYSSCQKIKDERTNMACWQIHPFNTICTFRFPMKYPLLITITVYNYILEDMKINSADITEHTIEDVDIEE